MTTSSDDPRFWRLPQVMRYTGLSRTAIYDNKSFPRPVRIGKSTVGWVVVEVREWADAKIRSRDMVEPTLPPSSDADDTHANHDH